MERNIFVMQHMLIHVEVMVQQFSRSLYGHPSVLRKQ